LNICLYVTGPPSLTLCSPFSDILGAVGEEPPEFYGELTGMQMPCTKSKPPPILVTLEVTLAEAFNGAMKSITYQRKKAGHANAPFLTAHPRPSVHLRSTIDETRSCHDSVHKYTPATSLLPSSLKTW